MLQVAPWGYDLRVYVQQVSGLSVVGHPYVMVLMHLGGHDVQYRWGCKAVLRAVAGLS